jgi:hypothetical protein
MLLLLAWRGALKPGFPVSFEMMEAGRARIMRRDSHEALVDATPSADHAHIGLAFIPSEWAIDNRITLPATIAAHVIEGGETGGAIFFIIRANAIEMWSDRRRLFELAEAREALRDHLPS